MAQRLCLKNLNLIVVRLEKITLVLKSLDEINSLLKWKMDLVLERALKQCEVIGKMVIE